MPTYRIFIAHSSMDEPYAMMLRDSLTNIVEFDTYLAQDYSSFGENFKKRIQDAIEKCSIFICCLSESGLESQWVNQELGYACAVKNQRKGYHIIPISSTDLTLKGMITRDSEDILYQDKYNNEELIAKIILSIRKKIRYGNNYGTLNFKVKCPSCLDVMNLPLEYNVMVPPQTDLTRMMEEGKKYLLTKCPKCSSGTYINIFTWNEDFLFYEDFDDYQRGEQLSSEWTVNLDKGIVEVVKDKTAPWGSKKCVMIKNGGTDTHILHRIPEFKKGIIDYWIKIDKEFNDFGSPLIIMSPDSIKRAGVNEDYRAIYMDVKGGKLRRDYGKKDSWGVIDIIQLTPDKWYNIVLDIDCSTHSYNLTIDGKTYSNITFPSEFKSINNIRTKYAFGKEKRWKTYIGKIEITLKE